MAVRRWLGAAILFFAAVPAARGQALVTGIVREDATRRPLEGVEVVLEGTPPDYQGRTNPSGEYTARANGRGRFSRVLLFRLVGYHPVRMQAMIQQDSTVTMDVILVPVAARLDPIVVAGEKKGPHGMGREAFEERRKLGFGEFIDSLEMRRSEDRHLSDLLRGRNGIVIAQNQYVSSTRTGCYMQIVYDGHSLYSPSAYQQPAREASPNRSFSRGPQRSGLPSGPQPMDINSFSVSSLESAEIYSSLADTPLQFGGAEIGCGTLVLWSRRGGPVPKAPTKPKPNP